jgi:hypothetical protein
MNCVGGTCAGNFLAVLLFKASGSYTGFQNLPGTRAGHLTARPMQP